ncbi:chloride channel activity [Sparganum proliferum]
MWPDSWTIAVCAFAPGDSEKVRLQRSNLLRYFNLSYYFCLLDISPRIRRQFPTLDHLVESGIMTKEEMQLYLASINDCGTGVYFLPLLWAGDLVAEMEDEGTITSKRAVGRLIDELMSGRIKLATLYAYDWINVPLVYTQVSAVTIIAYFAFALFAWQMLDPALDLSLYRVDIYVPVFGLLHLIFYTGWLKVALTLLNPFGEDADDFELGTMLDRNFQFSSFWDKAYSGEIPPVLCDVFPDGDNVELPENLVQPEIPKKPRERKVAICEPPSQSWLAHLGCLIPPKKVLSS